MSGPTPSPRLARIAGGVAGGFMLARGRADGMALIDTSPAGAWASFAAAWLCLPGYVALRLMSETAAVADPLRLMAAEAIGYVIGWFAFPLLMVGIAEGMGRSGRFPAFVAAWNWSKVPQLVVMLAASTVGAIGGLPVSVLDALALLALAYIVWISWFAARAALAVSAGRAVFVVVLDLILGLFITGLTITLAQN
ncbi:MAG: hypothetical protein MUC89_13195 [Acetobacteraceae bacterium]|jgi:hypothetical protein|nr:hypothetical protein [Acetobacteraceae bacterium]